MLRCLAFLPSLWNDVTILLSGKKMTLRSQLQQSARMLTARRTTGTGTVMGTASAMHKRCGKARQMWGLSDAVSCVPKRDLQKDSKSNTIFRE